MCAVSVTCMKLIIHPELEIQKSFKLCSVLRSQCESSLSTYSPHHGFVYSLVWRLFDGTPAIGATSVFVFSFASANHHCVRMLSITDIYFRCKTKMFVDFHCVLLDSSLFAHIDPPRTLYSRRSRCLGCLVVIQLRTHEEITNNCFELLFIYRTCYQSCYCGRNNDEGQSTLQVADGLG